MVAPAAHDATHWARVCCAYRLLPATPPAQRSFPARYLRHINVEELSSGWRHREPAGPAQTPMPSPRGRHERPRPGSSGGGALSSAVSQVAGVVPCRARGVEARGTPPGLARAGVETPRSPVEVGPSSSLRETASRPSRLVGPGGGMLSRHLSRHRNPLPVVPPVSSRRFSSEIRLSRGHPGWGAWKTSASPESPASSPVDMVLVFCREGSGKRGCGGRCRDGNDAKRIFRGRYNVVVSLLQVSVYLCFPEQQDMGLGSIQHQ